MADQPVFCESFAPATSSFSDCAASMWAPGGDMSTFTTSSSFTTSDTLPMNTSSLYTTADSGRMPEATFKQSDAPAPPHTELEAGQQPKITVTSDTTKPADFKVKADGTVEVSGKPFDGQKPLSEYKIAVEQGADQKVTDQLVNEIAAKINDKAPDVKPTLDAEAGLVSEAVSNLYKKSEENKEEDEEMPDKDDDGGIDGGGGGGGGGGGDDKDIDPDINDKDGISDDKDKDTNPINENDHKPIPPSVERSLESFATNRKGDGTPDWGFNKAGNLGAFGQDHGGWFNSFFSSEELAELGPPPWDPKKLQKVLNSAKFKERMNKKLGEMKESGDEKGAETLGNMFDKLSKDENYAAGLGQFMADQAAGKDASADQMNNYFNKDIQMAAKSSQVSELASQMHINLKNANEQQMQDLALSLAAGKTSKDAEGRTHIAPVTEQEKKNMQSDPLAWQKVSAYLDLIKENFNRKRAS